MDLGQNHFELFGLPARYTLDLVWLDRRYRELQREVHPDRFASASASEQRLSMQRSTRVNEAYQTLKSPLARAAYLIGLNGVDPHLETNTAMPQDFLVEQLELRETLEAASGSGDTSRLDVLARQLKSQRASLLAKIEAELEAQRWHEAVTTLRQLMFVEKLGEEVAEAEEGQGR